MDKIKFLMSDTGAEITAACREALEQKGVEVTVVEKDGLKVLQKMLAVRPQVVLLDAFMPGLDALAVKQKYNAAGERHTSFFVTGAFQSEEMVQELLDEGFAYYFVKPFDETVLANRVLKVAAGLDIQIICPLHGPVLKENLGHYIGLYDTWSSYTPETEGIVIAYTSVYGNTKKAVELLAEKLKEEGCPKVVVTDLARDDMAEAVEDAFRYGKLILATTTYNGDIFPFMKEFINHLTERSYQNRTIGFVENGSWTPMAAKIMKAAFEKSKNITFADTTVTIRSAVDETSEAQIVALAKEMK